MVACRVIMLVTLEVAKAILIHGIARIKWPYGCFRCISTDLRSVVNTSAANIVTSSQLNRGKPPFSLLFQVCGDMCRTTYIQCRHFLQIDLLAGYTALCELLFCERQRLE